MFAIVIHICDCENQELIFDTCIDIFARQGFTIHFFSVQQVNEREADCKLLVNKDNAQYRILIFVVFFMLSVLRACLPGDRDFEDPV